MRSLPPWAVLGVASSLTSCAIHPLPEDVTGLTTYQIVRQIRCETRQAVIDAALRYLTRDPIVDAASRDVGLRFQEHPETIRSFDPKLFKGETRKLLAFFWGTGVAYNYTLRATEINNIDTTVNLLRPFTNGTAGAGLTGNFDRQRRNERTFTITDDFAGLIQKIPIDYCNGRIVGENYIYPIAGKIGIDKVVRDFVNLSLFGNLAGPKDKSDGPPTLVDTLDFQTTIGGSVIPKVTFTPMSQVFRVSDATLTASASRADDHQVIVGLALPKSDTKILSSTRNSLFGGLLTASGGGARQTAAHAVDQVLARRLFQPEFVLGNR